MFWNNYLGAYTDFLTRDIKIKSMPTVLHHKNCPTCEAKLVNVYYSSRFDNYICKKCMDKLSGENPGEK